MTARWYVEIVRPQDGKATVWNTYPNRELAEVEAAKLRVHKFSCKSGASMPFPNSPSMGAIADVFLCGR